MLYVTVWLDLTPSYVILPSVGFFCTAGYWTTLPKLILNVGDVGRRKPNPRNLNKVADLVGTGDVKIASLAAEVVLVFAAGEGIGEILSDLIVCGVVKACLEDG